MVNLLWLFTLGCNPVAVPSGDVVARWIKTDPETVLVVSDLVHERAMIDLGPTDPAMQDRWRAHHLRVSGMHDSMLEAEPYGNDPWFAISEPIDARSVVAIEVEIVNPGPAEVQLFWAGRWQRYSMERMARPSDRRPLGAGRLLCRFEVGDHPAWRGTIRSLRIDPSPGGVGPVRLGAVRLIGWEIDESRIDRAAGRTWKVALGRSTRNALPCPPGRSWDLTLRVPDQATLDVAYGIQHAVNDPVDFQVIALEIGNAPRVLFEKTLQSGVRHAERWHEAVVDLGPLAGREVTLRLTTSGGTTESSTPGFPVWGNPEVIAPTDPGDVPNVVLILLDTLRADRLSCYGHTRPTSPNIDRWAADSAARFTSVVAPSPWTLPSHASLFTGMDALHHGFNFWGTAPNSLEMVAEILRREGFTTGAATGGGVLRPRFGFAQGFDTFDYWGEPDSAKEVDWVFEATRTWIEAHRERRFFFFAHTYEMHAPHRRRQPFFDALAQSSGITPATFDLELRTHPWKDLIAPGDYFVVHRPGSEQGSSDLTANETETIGLMYDSAVATVDRRIGELLDLLNDLDLRRRTIVIVTSDHGEALGENGRAGHSYLEDYNLMVPLIVDLPGSEGAGAVIDAQVRLVDVMPTILDAVGLGSAPGIDGRSLLPLIKGEVEEHPQTAWAYAASSNRGLALRIDDKLKYVFPDPAWKSSATRESLHDLAVDHAEEHNLAPSDPRLGELRARTRRTILAQHRGLRLHVRNASSGVLMGRLSGAWAAQNRIKTAEIDPRPLRRTNAHGRFKLEPGGRTSLLLTPLHGSNVALDIRLKGPGNLNNAASFEALDLSVLKYPVAITPTENGWILTEGSTTEIDTGFLITRVGDASPIVADGLPAEAETLDQLRALGYVQ